MDSVLILEEQLPVSAEWFVEVEGTNLVLYLTLETRFYRKEQYY